MLLCSPPAVWRAGGGNENDEGVAYFDVDGGPEKSFFDFFERADIIPLETSDSSVVGSLSDVEFVGDTLFGLDRRGSRIVSFTADGAYLGRFPSPAMGRTIMAMCLHFTSILTTATWSFWSHFTAV